MQLPYIDSLRCPRCKNSLRVTEVNSQTEEIDEAAVACEKSHLWKVEEGIISLIYPPITEEDKKWISEYDEMAEGYDELVLQYNDWLGVDIMKERQNLAQFIPIEGPARIIDVSVGTAANFMALSNVFKDKMGRFNLHGLDLSRGMLRVSQRKARERNLTLSLVHSNVFNIPYKDDFFDIVIHSGGINTFSDIPRAFSEMLRIVKKDGFVIVNDEGLSPAKRETEDGKSIIENNKLFAARPPLEHLPENAKDVEVTYILNDTFYQIVFRK
ncbi:MAG: class I SAM-dependent methyltransferase [Candidatus Thorarchaeota archaeon]|nr:class I SAM-dependent methyltransferase [Candidatus Thorarchaeota archaeon]